MGILLVPFLLIQIPYMMIEKFIIEVVEPIIYPPIEFMRDVGDEISGFFYDIFND